MAICFSPKSSITSISNTTAIPLLFCSSSISVAHFIASRPQSISPPILLHRPPFPNFQTRSGPCRVSSPGPTPPPESDPDGNEDSLQLSGLAATLSTFQDTSRIFIAVLFWMSLFFWSSVWEGWSSDKPDKGSQSRR